MMIKKIKIIICVTALPACLVALITGTAARYFDMDYFHVTVIKAAVCGK